MTAFAERYFELIASDGGQTKRERLQGRLERALRKGNAERVAEIEAELAVPPFPKETAYIWQAYLRLRRRMAGGFAGPNPVGWQDIDAFGRQSGLRLHPWEIALIETIDDIYLRAGLAKKMPLPKEKGVIATVAASDGVGVKAMMGSIGRRKTVKRG